jgi:FLYWCH zinc finger domain.
MESSVQHFLEPDPVIFLETPKRKPCALRAGHRYLFSKKNCFDIIFWRCERYFKEKCKGSMATAGNTIVKAISHTCIPDPSRVDIITALHACRRRVREDIHTPISRIVAEEFTPLRDRGVDNVPSYLSLKSSLHRERQKHLANRPNPGDFLCIEAVSL